MEFEKKNANLKLKSLIIENELLFDLIGHTGDLIGWGGEMAHATMAHAIMAHVIMAHFTMKCQNGALTKCRIVKLPSHYDTLAHAYSMAHCYEIILVCRIVIVFILEWP